MRAYQSLLVVKTIVYGLVPEIVSSEMSDSMSIKPLFRGIQLHSATAQTDMNISDLKFIFVGCEEILSKITTESKCMQLS